jgi:hypothetical protein
MKLATLFAAAATVSIAVAATPVAAERVNTLPPTVPNLIYPAPAPAPPPAAAARSCIVTQQRPDAAKLITLDRRGPQITSLSSDGTVSTTTVCTG